MHYDYKYYRPKIIELLLRNGADPELTNIDNKKPHELGPTQVPILNFNASSLRLSGSKHFFSSEYIQTENKKQKTSHLSENNLEMNY